MRFPLLPTLLVAAAVAAMIGLGLWQVRRAGEKDALRTRYETNMRLPLIALPPRAVADESLLYRRATGFCLEVTAWRKAGGRSAFGRAGTRLIAECRTGAEGPGFVADMGVAADPKAQPAWKGGEVAGRIAAEPSSAGWLARIAGRGPPPRPMIVAERPAPGLEASAPPVAQVANTSRFYALQWFFFAAAAAIIYLLALRRRQREKLPPAG